MPGRLFKRIDTVFLPVRDLDQAIAWYSAHLGLGLLWKGEGVAALKVGETPLSLVQHRFPGLKEPPQDFEFRPVTEVPFNFFTGDIQKAHAALQAAGIDVSEIVDQGRITDFQFKDPDGNLLGVCWWPE